MKAALSQVIRLCALVALLPLLHTPLLAHAAHQDNVWQRDRIVYLCGGTKIYPRSDTSQPPHTIVPHDDWPVRVIGGPRGDWWDIKRDDGGSGWIQRSEAERCRHGSGGSSGGGSSSGGSSGGSGGASATADPRLVGGVQISNSQPYPGDRVECRFTLRNDGQQGFRPKRLGVGIDGPQYLDCGWREGLSIGPGSSYSYEGAVVNAPDRPGTYTAYATYQKEDGSWVRLGGDATFTIRQRPSGGSSGGSSGSGGSGASGGGGTNTGGASGTSPSPPPQPLPEIRSTPQRGFRFGLARGTRIFHGPQADLTAGFHTVVPEDQWLVVITDGPRHAFGHEWFAVDRRAAGDPSGGTGWFAYRALAVSPTPPPAPQVPDVLCEGWRVGNTVCLSAGTRIYHGPTADLTRNYHTTVPEDNWPVRVIGGPRRELGWEWFDIKRDDGGSGWVPVHRYTPPPSTSPDPDEDEVAGITIPGPLLLPGSAISRKYDHIGGATFLGPVTRGETVATPSRYGTMGTVAWFAGGFIHSSHLGTFETHGDIARVYLAEQGSGGRLGFPKSDEYSWNGARRSDFEGGYIAWDYSINQYRAFTTFEGHHDPNGCYQQARILTPEAASQLHLRCYDKAGNYWVKAIHGIYLGMRPIGMTYGNAEDSLGVGHYYEIHVGWIWVSADGVPVYSWRQDGGISPLVDAKVFTDIIPHDYQWPRDWNNYEPNEALTSLWFSQIAAKPPSDQIPPYLPR